MVMRPTSVAMLGAKIPAVGFAGCVGFVASPNAGMAATAMEGSLGVARATLAVFAGKRGLAVGSGRACASAGAGSPTVEAGGGGSISEVGIATCPSAAVGTSAEAGSAGAGSLTAARSGVGEAAVAMGWVNAKGFTMPGGGRALPVGGGVLPVAAKLATTGLPANIEVCCDVAKTASKVLNEAASLFSNRASTAPDPPASAAGLTIPSATASRAWLRAGERKAGVAIIGNGSGSKVRIVLIKIRARICAGTRRGTGAA